MPGNFQKCFDEFAQKTDLGQSVGELIVWECVQQCTQNKVINSNNQYSASKADQEWFMNLVKMMDPTRPCNPNKRPLRVRKEIRRLSLKERRRLFRAMKMLKHKPYGNITRYDFIALMHSGDLVPRAHFGSNFLPWHRFYLLLFENALRQMDPTVVLPYWDTGLESAMNIASILPTESIMWSPEFMGNGDGEVRTGTFRNWSTADGPLIRNYGARIPDLFLNDVVINRVLTQPKLENISRPTAQMEFNLEFYHGAPHVWLGGQMGGAETAAWEPVFFFYHTFIDYIFEQWRIRAKANGTDVVNEWPATVEGFHAYGQTFGFGNLTNIQGMSDYFTSCVYTYEQKPTCSAANVSCGSQYLVCNLTSQWSPICRSKSRSELETSNSQQQCERRNLEDGIQNTFCCNRDCTTKNWVYVPVEIIQYRPPEYRTNHAFPVTDNRHIRRDCDIYTVDQNMDLVAAKSSRTAATLGNCTGATPHDIIIETIGLNYQGHYQEVAIPDSRLPLSKTIAYIAVKKPQYGISEVFISAADTCGRVCKIYCRSQYNKQSYHPCSGAFEVLPDYPLEYGHSIEDMARKMWNLQSGSCPNFSEDEVKIRILCDYSPDWIWTSAQVQSPAVDHNIYYYDDNNISDYNHQSDNNDNHYNNDNNLYNDNNHYNNDNNLYNNENNHYNNDND